MQGKATVQGQDDLTFSDKIFWALIDIAKKLI
jgi:hypothetical protein